MLADKGGCGKQKGGQRTTRGRRYKGEGGSWTGRPYASPQHPAILSVLLNLGIEGTHVAKLQGARQLLVQDVKPVPANSNRYEHRHERDALQAAWPGVAALRKRHEVMKP